MRRPFKVNTGSSTSKISSGSRVTLTTKADEGYKLREIKVTDANDKEITLTKQSNGIFSFTMPSSNVEVKAVFTKTGETKNDESKTDSSTEEAKTIKMQIGNTKVTVDDKEISNDVAPVIVNDRTLVPIRIVTETLGGEVEWDGSTKTVTLKTDGKEITMTIGKVLEKYGVATTASRNICGNYPVHDELEEKLAKFKGVEATLVFNCGVTANSGLIPQLVGKGDFIYSDELNHGSIIDGCRLSGAKIKVFRHMDMAHLEELLQEPVEGKRLIITDGVFSMDGDLAPLPEMADLADQYNALLVVDDAHGDGVMGPAGRGTVDHFGLRDRIIIETGSLSKAFGSAGGFVAGPKEFIEALRPKARSFIFTASPMAPCLTAAAAKAVDLVMENTALVDKLWENRNYFADRLSKLGLNIGTSVTPVIPIIVGDAEKAQKLSEMMYERGVYAQALQFPMVPRGTARLRTILSADHTKEDLDKVVDALEECAKALDLIR